MKEYIYDMIDLRSSLDKVWDELTDTLKHKFGGLEVHRGIFNESTDCPHRKVH